MQRYNIIKLCVLCSCIGFMACNNITSKADYQQAALYNVELGEKYLQLGQIERAHLKLIKALDLQPNLPQGHAAMAYFYQQVGDSKDAERHYKLAIMYGKHAGRYYNSYGLFLCQEKRYQDAYDAYHKGLKDKKYSQTAEIYENMAQCAQCAQDNAKAQQYYTLSRRHNPQRPLPALELAQYALRNNTLKQAEQYIAEYKKFNSPTARSTWLSYQIYNKLNKQDMAASEALLLRNAFADSAECNEFYARSHK